MFVFAEAGIYVFRDAGNAAKETIVAVMGEGGTCPSSVLYEAKSYASLLQVGAALKAVSLSPDWTLFLAACGGFLVVILLTGVTVSHIYNKNWDQDPARKSVVYQMKQYTKLVRSDIEDPKALVSINSDASAFQFRRAAATDAFVAADGGEAPPAAKRTHEAGRALDLAELERLKEGLDQQVSEMKKLYSKDEHLDLSGDEGDGDMNAQILYLKRLIEQNKTLLSGEGGDDSDIGSADGQADEEAEQKADAEAQRKQKEEEEYQEAARKARELQEGKASSLRDGLNDEVLADFAEKAELMQERLRELNSAGGVDASKLLAEIGASGEEMGRALDADKARQAELLRKRMEARNRKRAKLQGDLAAIESQIDTQEQNLKARKEAIENKHDTAYEEKCRQFEQEHA